MWIDAARMRTLRVSLARLEEDGDTEMYRYFPVAAIAALESFFKYTVAAIIAFGQPYTERGVALAKDSLRSFADIYPLLHRGAITLGELIAHSLPFNSVASLESAYGGLFDAKLKDLVARSVDPYEYRGQSPNASPIVKDVAELWRALSVAFERRHILAHEAGSAYSVSYAEASADLDSCKLFMSAMQGVMWATVWKDLPLTQHEMNAQAGRDYVAARAELAARVRHAIRIATKAGRRGDFRKTHLAWMAYFKCRMAYEDAFIGRGTIAPLLGTSGRIADLRARIEALERSNSLDLLEGPAVAGN